MTLAALSYQINAILARIGDADDKRRSCVVQNGCIVIRYGLTGGEYPLTASQAEAYIEFLKCLELRLVTQRNGSTA